MINKLRNYILSNEHSLDERRFVLAGSIGCVSVLAVLISVLTTSQSLLLAGALILALAIMAINIRRTVKTKHYLLGSSVIIILTNLFIIPMGYLLGGGIDSGAPLWLVIGVVMVFVLFRGKWLITFLIMTAISTGCAIYAGALHPEMVVGLQEGVSKHADTYGSLIAVSVLIGVLFLFQSSALSGELKRAEGQKGEIEKLNSLQSNFFASMSHEIRTPINTIIGLNEMTMREKNLPEEVKENTLNIQNASKMLLSLINDILDMSKIQSGKMEIISTQYDTSAMLSDITNLHWNRAMEKGLHFDIQVGEDIPPMLYGDETRIKQVIINLLTNAIKYTEEGFVTLRFGGESTGVDTFMLCVEVEDSGIGIRKENIEHLFDSFSRIENEESKNIEGSGLGLSIAKQLVDLMNGTITVNSIYTKGSIFRVEIPQQIVSSGNMKFHKPGVITQEQPKYQQTFEAPEAKVLIVDDNDLNRIVCRKLLRSTQVKVDLAESGFECIEMTNEKHYDVIFMDHEMPQMDGIETLHRLRQNVDSMSRDTPVIALTANAGSDREAYYLDKGFSAYLAKPIQSAQLEALLLACLPEELIEKTYVEPEETVMQVFETVQKLPFIVTTDSICDLPDELIRENDIIVMPYYIVTEDGRFRDMREISSDNLQSYLRSGKSDSYSEAASVEEYEEFFGEALSEARMVLHISGGKAISNAYDHALKAAESFGNVYVIDSGHISTSLGMMVIHASRMFKDGLRMEEVLEGLKEYEKRLRMCYLVPSLEKVNTKYRTKILARLFINVFNLEPAFTVKNGKLKIRSFLSGYVRNTTDQFIRNCVADKNDIDRSRVYVTFCGCSPEKRSHVLEEIERYVNFDKVIVTKSSAATFCNCGPDSFGIIYETRK